MLTAQATELARAPVGFPFVLLPYSRPVAQQAVQGHRAGANELHCSQLLQVRSGRTTPTATSQAGKAGCIALNVLESTELLQSSSWLSP